MLRARAECRGLLFFAALALNGCGTLSLLFGTEKPVDEKSKSYQVEDLAQGNAHWTKVDRSMPLDYDKELDAPDALSTSVSDVAYLSSTDASVISLNSSCGSNSTDTDLQTISDSFFYGMSDLAYRQECGVAIENLPALQTTVRGSFYGNPRILRTVVFRKGSCQFVFMYLAVPEKFGRDERTFSSFLASFKFKTER